ncbi:MAG: neuromedin U [Hyphomicrobiales bacterium]
MLLALVAPGSASAAETEDTAALAKAAQNPIANMISLPFQNNTFFGVGPDEKTANVLNIQPVYPTSIGDWNIITRTIVPLIYVPDLTAGLPELPSQDREKSEFGLGDINFSAYLSPATSGELIWGIGPSITLDSATSRELGSGKYSAGPAAVVVWTPKPWVVGTLVRQLWSFAGDTDRKSVSQLLIQPFVNYNFGEGWYAVSAPIMTANWQAKRSADTWLVPLGGGFGKIFRIGSQPMNVNVQGFRMVESPKYGPDWEARFQLQFLFPK